MHSWIGQSFIFLEIKFWFQLDLARLIYSLRLDFQFVDIKLFQVAMRWIFDEYVVHRSDRYNSRFALFLSHLRTIPISLFVDAFIRYKCVTI